MSILDIRVAVISTIAGVAQNDHGSLFGLGDDDHSQYLHVDNNRTVNATHNFVNGLTSNGLINSTSGNFTNLTVNNVNINDTTIYALGSISGSNAINYSSDRLIQTLTLGGTSTTFTKGTGWPSSSVSRDIVLRITVTSATSITWTIISDWFNQPPAGALSIGTHIFLLRAIGSSIIEGHYIGNKTN